MCGRYGVISGEKEIKKRFDVGSFSGKITKSYNLAPTQNAPVITRHSPNMLSIKYWGFTPSWSKKILINAQAEKLSESRVWSKAFKENRCIVPSDFFFEWKKTKNGKKPYLIRRKNKEMMGFAGLVLEHEDEKGTKKERFVIITTKPNSLMEKIHNRMPAILNEEDEDEWLNPDNVEVDKLGKILLPINSEELEDYEVGPQVNSPKNNTKEIIKPHNESPLN
jgi:putative SOS response-associated peptidase YedK